MRILVCGSLYGRYYLDAVLLGGHEIAGLVAQGSARSLGIAKELGIPLFTSVDDAPPADAACVAVSGAVGTELAVSLLRRGIPVLREPVSEGALEAMWAAAEHGRTTVHINGHYGLFSPGREFVSYARVLRSVSRPLMIHLAVNANFCHSAWDLLGRALGPLEVTLEPAVVRTLASPGQLRVATYNGVVNGVPLTALHGRSHGLDAGDAAMSFFGDTVSIDFAHGKLTLFEAEGTLLFKLNPALFWQMVPLPKSADEAALDLLRPTGTIVRELSPPPPPAIESYGRRLRANLEAIVTLVDHAAGAPCPEHQTAGYLRSVVRATQMAEGTATTNSFDAAELLN